MKMHRLPDYEIIIKEHHVDSLGHVNNATYLQLLEEARWEIITNRGYGFEQVQKFQKGPVILEFNLKYFSELKLREKISISIEPLSYEGKIGKLKQCIIKSDGTVAFEAIMIYGLFDMKLRKLIMPTEDWLKALGIETV